MKNNVSQPVALLLKDVWEWVQAQKPKLTPEEATRIERMRSADECSRRSSFVLGGPVRQEEVEPCP